VLQPCIPPPADDGFRWTSKYLRTNPKIREIVDTILELSYMPPNRALSVGKVFVSITNCPEAETYLSNKTLVVKICGAYGWSFEFAVRLILPCYVWLSVSTIGLHSGIPIKSLDTQASNFLHSLM
jgi:hypothetical protein